MHQHQLDSLLFEAGPRFAANQKRRPGMALAFAASQHPVARPGIKLRRPAAKPHPAPIDESGVKSLMRLTHAPGQPRPGPHYLNMR